MTRPLLLLLVIALFRPVYADDGPRTLCEGLDVPESVVHDTTRARYLVSCVGGKPAARDGDGKIIAVDPETGAKTELAKDLNGPKGLAIVGDHLIVADINRVVALDLASGEKRGEKLFKDAKFLNDVAAHPSASRVAVSDTAGSMVRVLEINVMESAPVQIGFGEGPKVSPVNTVNGLVWRNVDELVAVSWSQARPLLVSPGKKRPVSKHLKLSRALKSLDGILIHGKRWIVSDFKGGEVLTIPSQGEPKQPREVEVLASGLKTPADLGMDAKRKLILIPSFEGGRLLTLPLPK